MNNGAKKKRKQGLIGEILQYVLIALAFLSFVLSDQPIIIRCIIVVLLLSIAAGARYADKRWQISSRLFNLRQRHEKLSIYDEALHKVDKNTLQKMLNECPVVNEDVDLDVCTELISHVKECGFTEVTKLAKEISMLPIEEGIRAEYIGIMTSVNSAWVSLFGEHQTSKLHADEHLDDFLFAFIKRYMEEEVKDIREHHLVMTNFVAYAQILRAIIDRFVALYDEHEMIFFTELCVPMRRWFNFRYTKAIEPVYEADERWTKNYLERLREIIFQSTSSDRISLKRYIPIVSSDNKTSHFMTEDELRAELNCKILVPFNYEPTNMPPCFGEKEIEVLINSLEDGSKLKAMLTENYQNAKNAFIILPTSELEKCQKKKITISNIRHKWVSLASVFVDAFHHRSDDVQVVPFGKELQGLYGDTFVKRRCPEDFFLMGIETDGERQWLYCLAAVVDEDIDRLKLWFLDPVIDKARDTSISEEDLFSFRDIKKYAEELLVATKQNKTKKLSHYTR